VQLDLPRLQFGRELLRLEQQVLGAHRRLERIQTTPIDCVSWSRKARCVLVNERRRRELDQPAIVSPGEHMGSTQDAGRAPYTRLD